MLTGGHQRSRSKRRHSFRDCLTSCDVQSSARVLKLDQKGRIAVGKDADLCLLDKETLEIDTVIANGTIMVQEKQVKVWGTFEQILNN
ncbi:amidohydrolase family protein [Enterococcus mundtii]|uniref:amidohydrolase family protein n=1 Tax=Enterococcus mundtii TaxID=53346 RepID=UPI003B84B466